MKIRIKAGDWGGDYESPSGRAAIKAFFQDVLAGKIKLCQLSPLGMWERGDGEEIPFRIAPALCKAGLMSADELVATLRAAGLFFEPIEITNMISEDSWMISKPHSNKTP